MPLFLAGKRYDVPGVYGAIEVVNLGSVTLPAFNNLLIIGSARQGLPSTATGKKAHEFIYSTASISDAKDRFGVSDITDALEYAKAGGAGVVHLVNIAAITQASATIQDNDSVPADTFDVTPKDKYWGAPGNDIKLTIATASNVITVTITPPKNHRFLTADAATTSKEITLESVDGLYVGKAIKIWDNAAASVQSTTITAVDTVNKKVTLADNPAAAYTTANYARIFEEDSGNKEVYTFADTVSISEFINTINAGNIITLDRSTYTGLVPQTLSASYIQEITDATLGTSPVATETSGGDFDTFAESAVQYLEEFRNFTKVRIRILNIISKSSAVHAVYNTLANDLRNNYQMSVQVVAGVASGDIALATSENDHPVNRAKALNSDDFILAGMGINDIAAYKSFAPLVAGMMSGNTVKRNLTGDVVSATKVEKFFGVANRESETAVFVNAGVLIIGTDPDGFSIVQGVNTWQNHDNIWTEDGAHTYLIQQRQIVDFVFEGYSLQMKEGVGADNFTPTRASQKGLGILQVYQDEGFITGKKMLKAWREGNAVKTRPEISPIGTTDFVGFEMVVLIEN